MIQFTGSKDSLWRAARSLGFRQRKTGNNKKLLTEMGEICEMRLNYIRNISKYRNEGCSIISMDMTYIHSSNMKDNTWTGNATGGLLTPVSKGQQAIIFHASGEEGFVPNTFLIFKFCSKCGGYHGNTKFNNYQ
jgi:hypothetical protein